MAPQARKIAPETQGARRDERGGGPARGQSRSKVRKGPGRGAQRGPASTAALATPCGPEHDSGAAAGVGDCAGAAAEGRQPGPAARAGRLRIPSLPSAISASGATAAAAIAADASKAAAASAGAGPEGGHGPGDGARPERAASSATEGILIAWKRRAGGEGGSGEPSKTCGGTRSFTGWEHGGPARSAGAIRSKESARNPRSNAAADVCEEGRGGEGERKHGSGGSAGTTTGWDMGGPTQDAGATQGKESFGDAWFTVTRFPQPQYFPSTEAPFTDGQFPRGVPRRSPASRMAQEARRTSGISCATWPAWLRRVAVK